MWIMYMLSRTRRDHNMINPKPYTLSPIGTQRSKASPLTPASGVGDIEGPWYDRGIMGCCKRGLSMRNGLYEEGFIVGH